MILWQAFASLKVRSRTAVSAISICLLSTLILSPEVFSQASASRNNPYLHRTWTSEDGLPQNSVVSILQGKKGYLWLGTFGGLARFDGVDFKVFNQANTPELRSARIMTLYEDGTGNLWMGTGGGLTRYRNGTFTTFTMRDGLPDNTVLSIARDRAGGLWIGTMRGLARFDAGKITSYATKPGMPKGAVSAIWQDKGGRLWLGTHKQGLISSERGVITTYSVKNGMPDDVVWALHKVRDGSMWVGTFGGLAVIKNGKVSRVFAKDGRPVGWVRSIGQDSQGALWVASSAGLLRWDGTSLTRFTRKDGLSDSSVRSIFVDREGNLWIGTNAGGLDRWSRRSVVAYTAKEGLSNGGARAIYQDHQGTVWVAIGSSLFRFKNGAFSAYPGLPRGSQSCPADLAEDHEGDLWIGDCVRGLLRLKDGRLTSYPQLGSRENGIQALFVDSEDAVWIGTRRNGLYRLKDGKLANYRTGNGLAANDVRYITEDHNGVLWLGTSDGISRFEDGRFTNYHAQGLAAVRDIRVAADGTLWIGTYGFGLFRFRDRKFVRITSNNGLFDDFISDILEDDRGNFWMSGNKGIFRVSQKDLNAFADGQLPSVTCVSYGVQDGMQIGEANGEWNPSAWKMRDGKLWFAMIKGVAVIDPSVTDRLPPPVVINRTMLNGRVLPSGQPVRILPGQTNLEIHYTAITFTRPEQVQFKYKLTALDRSWVDAGTRRTAYFPHLAPGKYTFTVIADNGEGVWNTTGASLGIVVVPPFWRTWWFLSLALLSLAMTALGGYHLRVANLKKARAAQEGFSRKLLASQEAERQRIAAELHDSLGQSLLIIKNRAELALTSAEDTETTKEQLDEISSAASHAVEEVRVIAHDLRPFQLDRFGLTKTLQAMCDQASCSCGIRFSTDLDEIDGLFPKEAETSIFRIVQEAISNVIRHSQATEAKLTIRRQGRELRLRIRDNGKGIGPAPTRTVRPRAGGFGLVGLAERVRMLGGSHSIETVPGQGVALDIRLAIQGGSDEG